MSIAAHEIEATSESGFDFNALLDEMRCSSNESLRREVWEARRAQQRGRLREAAATRILDEREALGAMPDASVSTRTAKATVEVARELETLPALAAAAWDASLSWDQLQPAVQLATPETDREWAHRAPRLAPVDLQRLSHQVQRASADDAQARRRARSVRAWRDHDQGMAGGKWWLPDVDGVLVDKVLEHMAERMRPETGEPWDSLAHRKADALVELARTYADAEPTGRFRIEIVNIVDPNATTFGPSVDGIPIAAETLAALTPQAKMRDCVIDEAGVARTVRRVRHALPADVERHVRRRDHHCRVPGCDATRGLQIHHTRPLCDNPETFDPAKLAGVCPYHHRFLEPHGPYRLIGNAEDPEGLRLEHRDERPRDGPDP